MARKIKNALVTGGAGFIGSHLTRRLLKDGWKVTVIDDLSLGKWENLPSHPNLIKQKVSILEDMSPFVTGCDVIFHLAALSGIQRSLENPQETDNINVRGTLNLLLAARDHGVKKFIFSSSMTVYGQQDHFPLTEEIELKPISLYGLQKKISEEYCQLFTKLWSLPTISLRYFNVYGPGMFSSGASVNFLPKFIKLMAQNKTPVINGDGEQTRDFTYMDDVIEANILAAKSTISGEVFNIGSSRNFSINEVVKLLNKFMSKDIKPTHSPAGVEQKSTLASFAKAKKLLGWHPNVKFEDGLKVTLAQYHEEE